MPAFLPGAPVTAKFGTQAHLLGVPAPPTTLRLKVFESARCWSLIVQAEDRASARSPLTSWLMELAPRRVEFGAHAIMRADFDFAPFAWLDRFRGVQIDMLRLEASGAASLWARGSAADVRALGEWLSTAREAALPAREPKPVEPTPALLTPGQYDALVAAVRLGYYRIPRPLNLSALASKLGVTSASLSERLRRAEGRVLARYVQSDFAWEQPFPDEAD